MPRLFVATYLNSDGVKRLQELGRANDHISEKWSMRARWVSPDKLHLTWLFLGEVEDESVDDVSECIGEAVGNFGSRAWNSGLDSNNSISTSDNSISASTSGSVSVAYDHFDLWPSARKARLGVIVPSTVAPEIAELASAISKSLSKFLTVEQRQANDRPFKPHLTVLRLAPSRRHGAHSGQGGHLAHGQPGHGRPRAAIEDVIVPASVFPIHQDIDRVELIESDMGKKVQGYLTRASFNIGTSLSQ